MGISIHAPSRERLLFNTLSAILLPISIHAPSRERHYNFRYICIRYKFQSTLPRGSDVNLLTHHSSFTRHFNPRSLAGATYYLLSFCLIPCISIHAPSRERQNDKRKGGGDNDFNPRSLAGATATVPPRVCKFSFQSTLPRGSDYCAYTGPHSRPISIHAPSRERLATSLVPSSLMHFNPRSLAGATRRT